jgi:beta-lactamase regulating signal transducer with metallopeptidase domain
VIAALLDHLWQSTLFAAMAGLLTLTLRRNGARIRFWLWFAASMKFLLPFSVLAALGGVAARLYPVAITAPHILALQPAAEPFLVPTKVMAVNAQHDIAPWLVAGWLLGLAAILAVRLVRWSRLRGVVADAHDVALSAPVRVKASASLLEPGLVGVLRPAVLLPAGLMARLSAAEMNAILAHEFTHFRNRDNLTAAIHMVVEALFWFYPPVWLIGARLIAEREQACDESVLASGHDPETYAGSILKVCRFCIQSPLACASGASGADLGRRVELIMIGEVARGLSAAKKTMLAGAAAAAIALPVMAGFLSSPFVAEVQRRAAVVQARIGEVAVQMVAAPLAAVLTPQADDTVTVVHARKPVVRAVPPPQSLPAVLPLPVDPVSPVRVQPLTSPAPQPVPVTTRPTVSPEQIAANALKRAVLALAPTGAGDPNAITCRVPQVLPGSRLPGPMVCKFNRVWAQLRAGGMEISADGTYLLTTMGRGRAVLALASRCYTSGQQPTPLTGTALDAALISACR